MTRKNSNDQKLTRRDFTRAAALGLGAAALSPLAPRTAAAGHHEEGEGGTPELVTDVASNELLLSQVKYVAVSEIEGKQCANCALLLQRDGDHGRCGLFQKGKVPVTAWCTSWIQKPGT